MRGESGHAGGGRWKADGKGIPDVWKAAMPDGREARHVEGLWHLAEEIRRDARAPCYLGPGRDTLQQLLKSQ